MRGFCLTRSSLRRPYLLATSALDLLVGFVGKVAVTGDIQRRIQIGSHGIHVWSSFCLDGTACAQGDVREVSNFPGKLGYGWRLSTVGRANAVSQVSERNMYRWWNGGGSSQIDSGLALRTGFVFIKRPVLLCTDRWPMYTSCMNTSIALTSVSLRSRIGLLVVLNGPAFCIFFAA